MRLFHVFPILSLHFGARASSLDSRQPDAHPFDARDVSDVCAMLEPTPDGSNVDFFVALFGAGSYGQFNDSMSQPISSVLSVTIMLIGSCLCESQVSQFLASGFPFEEFGIDSNTLTKYVRRKVTFLLNLPDRVSI